MSDLERYVELPTFFAPGAFAETRVGHVGILYDTNLLRQASDFLQAEVGRGLPADPKDLTFVYRFGEAGFERPEEDVHFHRANPSSRYVAGDHLVLDPEVIAPEVTKAQILALGRPVMQVQVKSDLPCARALAESVLFPPAEDHRMIASLGAWGRQFKEAFNRNEAPVRKRKLIQKVAAHYSGAILLQPRQAAA